MKTIHPTDILSYYDGIQVFEGRDLIGGHYIAMLIDQDGDYDRYLVTGARPERLRQFRAGDLDLRTLFLEAPGGEWFLIWTDEDPGESLTLHRQDGPLADTDFLPEDGCLLYGFINDESDCPPPASPSDGKKAKAVGPGSRPIRRRPATTYRRNRPNRRSLQTAPA